MPIYDMHCTACGATTHDVTHSINVLPRCQSCNGVQEHIWMDSPAIQIFPAGFFENAADGAGRIPYFSSRQKYKSYLKEHGMYADLVEGR